MALSLERVQKTSRKKTEKAESHRKVVSRRPWQNSQPQQFDEEEMSFAPLIDFSFTENEQSLPADLDVTSSGELIKTLLQFQVSEQFQNIRKRSYWLARLTYAESWWARLKIYPRFRFPIPSWMTQVEQK